MNKRSLIIVIALSITLFSCSVTNNVKKKPNIILIMADDMGYESLSTYGNSEYNTPVLDKMASEGIRFDNCVSQPLCTPSRVKIMTGLYNYRNYDFFGHLASDQYTFGNLMQDAGYSTCIAGKWQLNGLNYKDKITDWNDNTKPNKFGFEEYCLWQLTKKGNEGGRYANPLIEQNGKILTTEEVNYGPDLFSNYILDFIERKKDKPFFIYYPMVLVHDPFVPTPDSEAWNDKDKRYKNDTTYFKDMVVYTDKIVGNIVDKLKELDIDDNTIVIFTGDNGNHPTIFTKTKNTIIQGAKGNTIDAGTHVPLIISWPKEIKKGQVSKELIEFSDFFATFSDIVAKKVTADGKSFYPLLTGKEYNGRKTAFVHYDPKWGQNVNRYRNQFVRTVDYKLYPDGKFFNLNNDKLEKMPLAIDSLTVNENTIKTTLESELKKHPIWLKNE
ncbi:sulfatase-like hydrolase/transferase [Aureibaculum luteum]|uniref:sulfatase-like hydrolase/transferase n=1 Tax=Aureibaculum luteum TaxID=1548456 RepID=UPI000E52D155|nr:sulfatase-like hydrolase/transferase [Aureibaculum luteum]